MKAVAISFLLLVFISLGLREDVASSDSPVTTVSLDRQLLNQTQATPFSTGHLLVKLSPLAATSARLAGVKSGIASLDRTISKSGASNLRPLVTRPEPHPREVDRWFTLELRGAAEMLEVDGEQDVIRLRENIAFRGLMNAYEQVSQDPNVETVSLVHLIRPILIPGDTYFGDGSLWGVHKVNPTSAWDVTDGAGAVTAVIDTGVDYSYPDLAERIWTNPGESGIDSQGYDKRTNGIDDDQNTYIDDWRGWLFDTSPFSVIEDGNDPADDHGHGTHVSGTIAATGNNDSASDDGRRLVGVAFGSTIMPLKVINYQDYAAWPPGTAEGDKFGALEPDIVRALEYASQNGAQVVNMSLGGPGVSPLWEDALQAAHQQDVVLVAAAGNSNEDSYDVHPAGSPYVITVSASNTADNLACWSNEGVKVDVGAPGGDGANNHPGVPYCAGVADEHILSALSTQLRSGIYQEYGAAGILRDCCYLNLRGTSMAAPHVAGLAALIRAAHPDFTGEQVRQVIRLSADSGSGPNWSPGLGYGRIDASAALAISQPPPAAKIFTPSGKEAKSAPFDVVATALAPGGTFQLFAGVGTNPQSWTLLLSGPADKENQSLGSANLAALSTPTDQSVTVRLTVTSGGVTAEDRVLIYFDGDILPGWPREIGPFVFWTDTRAPATGDIDGNGSIEIIADAVFDTQLHVWNVDGSDYPGWPRTVGDNFLDFPSAPALIDLEDDGNKEIVVVTAYSGKIHIFDHTGVELPGFPLAYSPNYPSQCVVPYFQSAAALDVDTDGDKDLVVRCAATLFALDVGTRTILWSAPIDAGSLDPPGGTEYQAGTPAIADINNDGEPEIVTTGLNSVYVFGKNGQLLPQWPKTLGLAQSGQYLLVASPPAIADINADGLSEVVVIAGDADGGESGRLHAFEYDGTELSGWPIATLPSSHRFGGGPIIADLDTDGYPEIISLGQTMIEVFDHKGNPVSGWQGIEVAPGPSQSSPPSVADIDDDGKLEILVADPSTSAGIRAYKRGVGVIWQRSYGYSVGTPIAGDFNGNGVLDIAGAQFSSTLSTQQFFVWRHSSTDVVKNRLYWPQFRFDGNLTGNFRLPANWGPGVDTDLDGFSDSRESHLGTDRLDNCGGPVNVVEPSNPSLAWAADLHTTTTAFGPGLAKINIMDITSFMAPTYRVGTQPLHPNYHVRWDLDGDGFITGSGDATIVAGQSGHKCKNS